MIRYTCLLFFFAISCVVQAISPVNFDLNTNGELDLDDLRVMEEWQLEALFLNGEANQLPAEDAPIGERIAYQGLPLAKPANDAANMPWELIWGGKTFYRDWDGQLRLDNALLPPLKEFLGLQLNLVRAEVSFDTSIEDGAAVVLIDYGQAEVPLFRPVRDEIRLINPEKELYIGRASVYIYPSFFLLKRLRSITLISLVNSLLDNGYNCRRDNGGFFPQDEYCFGIWFALQKQTP